MKSKINSSKLNLISETNKSTKKLSQSKTTKSISKKNHNDVRKNLEGTLKLLQTRLSIKSEVLNNKTTLVGLSKSIYEMIDQNIPIRIKCSSFVPTQDTSEQESTGIGNFNDKQRSHSSHSSMIEYFNGKFGGNTADEKEVERKLKALSALKKSQEMASKNRSQYNLSSCSIREVGCDVETRQIVIGKLKKRSNE